MNAPGRRAIGYAAFPAGGGDDHICCSCPRGGDGVPDERPGQMGPADDRAACQRDQALGRPDSLVAWSKWP
jgi:hypothetical protein